MDIIEVTRELGRALQNDERYIAMVAARQASDEDQALQEAIGEFNLKRMAINKEAQKEDRNEETMKRLNEEFRAVYAKIMENEHMLRYNDAKTNSTPCCSASPASSACARRRGPGDLRLRPRFLRRRLLLLRRLPLRGARGRQRRACNRPVP